MKAADYRAKHMTEDELQSAVTGMLDAHGWMHFHDNDARRNRAGLPDIIATHESGYLLMVELKGPKTKIRDAQRDWSVALHNFRAMSRSRSRFWTGIIRPADWDHCGLQEFIAEAGQK